MLFRDIVRLPLDHAYDNHAFTPQGEVVSFVRVPVPVQVRRSPGAGVWLTITKPHTFRFDKLESQDTLYLTAPNQNNPLDAIEIAVGDGCFRSEAGAPDSRLNAERITSLSLVGSAVAVSFDEALVPSALNVTRLVTCVSVDYVNVSGFAQTPECSVYKRHAVTAGQTRRMFSATLADPTAVWNQTNYVDWRTIGGGAPYWVLGPNEYLGILLRNFGAVPGVSFSVSCWYMEHPDGVRIV
jgi:hypothetical protein